MTATNMLRRINDARIETLAKLEKAQSYSRDFQKPAQIAFYVGHIAYLDKLAAGEQAEKAVADTKNWDVMQCQIDALQSA
jgi:hypothetical protein